MRLFFVSVLLLLGVMTLGCSGTTSDAASDTPVPSVTAPALARPPAATATSGGASVTMGVASYCWGLGSSGGICVDAAGPVTGPRPLTVSRGARVTIQTQFPTASIVEADVSAIPAQGQPLTLPNGEQVWNFPPIGGQTLPATIDAQGVHFELPLAPGRYVVHAFLRVGQGDVSYGVLVELK